MILIKVVYCILITACLAVPLIEKFGFVTYPAERAGGKAVTNDDVHMTLWWDYEIIQCTVQPRAYSTWYYCYPDHDSSDYCWDPSKSRGHNLLFTMDGTDGVWMGEVRVTLTDGSWANARHFCTTMTGDDRISIPGQTDMAKTYCTHWNSLRIYEFMCVSAGPDCNNNDYVVLNFIDPNVNQYEGRINGRNGRDLSAPILSQEYQCGNVCMDGLFCNGEEYWDPIDIQCKDGKNVTCPVHSYCDNAAATCLRDCNSFAIDEYLMDCSTEFSASNVEIDGLTSSLANLTETVNEHVIFETHIANLTRDLNALTVRVNNHDTDITNVNTRITSELNVISNSISQLTSNMSSYNTRFTTIETEIEGMRNEINFLTTQIKDFGPAAKNKPTSIDLFTGTAAHGLNTDVIIILLLIGCYVILIAIGCYVYLSRNKKQNFKFEPVHQIDDEAQDFKN